MANHMLTTVDNPYNPFTHYDEWYAYDERAGYRTPGLLARVVTTSHNLSEPDQDAAIEDAMQQIVDENVLGVYKLIESD